MDAQEIDVALDELENRLDRLRSLYEQYFLGIEKIEPQVARKDVDRRFWILRRTQIRNTARRFRMQVLIQRYNTFQQHWARICREIENGTYTRHLLKAQKKLGEEPKTWAAKRRLGYFRRVPKGDDAQAAVPEENDDGTYDVDFADDMATLDGAEPPADAKASAAVPPTATPPGASPLSSDRAVPGAPVPRAAARPAFRRSDPAGPRPSDFERLDLDLDADDSREPAPRAEPEPQATRADVSPPVARAVTATAKGSPLPERRPRAPASAVALPRTPVPANPAMPKTPQAAAHPAPAVPKVPQVAARPAPAAPKIPDAAARPIPAAPKIPDAAARPIPAAPKIPDAAARPIPAAPPPREPARRAPAVPADEIAGKSAQPRPEPAPARPAAIKLPAASPASPAPAAAVRPVHPVAKPAPESLSDERVRQLHGDLVNAKKKLNQGDSVSFDALARTLRETERKLRLQHAGRTVDFQVVVKDGKPVVKPVVRK